MKLGQLNAAIRAAPQVKFRFNLGNRHPVSVVIQKGSLLEALAETFPEGRGQETNLKLNEEGFITLDE